MDDMYESLRPALGKLRQADELSLEDFKTLSEDDFKKIMKNVASLPIKCKLTRIYKGQVPVDAMKTIFVVSPPTAKGESPTVSSTSFASQRELAEFCSFHRGNLEDSSHVTARFANLVEGGTYTFAGPLYKAMVNDARRRQVDDKVLEFEAALTVKNIIGAKAHVHHNVKVAKDDGSGLDNMEIDAVVHEGGEGVPESVAYLVEASYSPQPSEVGTLAKKVEMFKAFAQTDPHFRSVCTVIPVLAGRHWQESTIKAAIAAKQWRVAPCGGGYHLIRGLHMLARRVK